MLNVLEKGEKPILDKNVDRPRKSRVATRLHSWYVMQIIKFDYLAMAY